MRAWILEHYHNYARTVLAAGLVVMIAVRLTASRDTFNLTKLTLLWVFTLVALALWIASAVERRVAVPRLRLFVAASAFLVAVCLATVFSINWRVSLIGAYGRFDGVIPLFIYATVAFLIVALYWESPADMKDIPRAAVLGVIADAGVVVLQHFNLEGVVWADITGSVSTFPVGTIGNSDFAGAFLGIAFPCCLYALIAARRRATRLFFWAVVALDLAALWFTATRGGMLAAATGSALVLVAYRHRLPRWLIRAAVGATCLALGVVVVGGFHPGMTKAPGPLAKVHLVSSSTLGIRVQYWAPALAIVAHHPLVGTGPETFLEAYTRYREPAEGAKNGMTLTDEPHNVLMGYAADTGLLGAGTYLSLIVFAFLYAWRRTRNLTAPQRDLLVCFAAMLVAYLTQAFFSIDIPPLAAFGWVALGGIGCLADPMAVEARRTAEAAAPATPKWVSVRREAQGRSTPHSDPVRIRRAWLCHTAIAVGLVCLVTVGVLPWWADHLAREATEPLPNGNSPSTAQVLADYAAAARFNPLESTYPTLAGTAEAAASNDAQSPPEAIAHLSASIRDDKRGLKLMPHDVLFVSQIAQDYAAWARFDTPRYRQAQFWWQRAIALDPSDWKVHSLYAETLASWAASGKSAARAQEIRQLKILTAMRPLDADQWLELAGAYQATQDLDEERAALERALHADPGQRGALALLSAMSSNALTSFPSGP